MMLISSRPQIHFSATRTPSLQGALTNAPAHTDSYTPSLRFGNAYHSVSFEPTMSLDEIETEVANIKKSGENGLEKVSKLVELAGQNALKAPKGLDSTERANKIFNVQIVPAVLQLLQEQLRLTQQYHLSQKPNKNSKIPAIVYTETAETVQEHFQKMLEKIKYSKKPFPLDTLPFFIIVNNISQPALQLHQLSQQIRQHKNQALVRDINKNPDVTITTDKQKQGLVESFNYEQAPPADEKGVTELLERFELSKLQVSMVKALLGLQLYPDQTRDLEKLIEQDANNITAEQIDRFAKSAGLMDQINKAVGMTFSPVVLAKALEKTFKRDLRDAEKEKIKSYINETALVRQRQRDVHNQFETQADKLNIDIWDRHPIEQLLSSQFFDLNLVQINKIKTNAQKNTQAPDDIALLKAPMSDNERKQLTSYNESLKQVEGILKDEQQTIDEKVKALLAFNTKITLYEENQGIRNGFFRLVIAPQVLHLMNQKALEVTAEKATRTEFDNLKKEVIDSPAWKQGLFADNKIVCEALLSKGNHWASGNPPLFNLFK